MTGLAAAFLIGLAAWTGVRTPGRRLAEPGRRADLAARAPAGPRVPPGLVPLSGGVQRRWLAICGGAALLGLIALDVGVGVLSLIVAGGVGAAGVARLRAGERRARDRQRRAAVAALRVVASEMGAGRSSREALTVASREAADPAVRSELMCAVAFGQWGGDEAALLVRARAGGPWLSQLGGCLTVCAQTGAAPVAVIEELAYRADQGEQHRHEVAVSVAGPRAQARILAALPVAGVVLGAAFGGSPLRLLVSTSAGAALLLAGVGLEVAGLMWMQRLSERALAQLP
ncbi:MAG: type II secretion system F family protein [Frankiaceae bacterium]